MALEKLPLELEEEILLRTHPISLSGFRTVCKRWNSLLNDKSFLVDNFHLASVRPEFMIQTESKTYSLCFNLEGDPKVIERELTFNLDNLARLESHAYTFLGECNGFLLCGTNGRALVWNPLLKQTRWIEPETEAFFFSGLGYDNSKPEKNYKIIGEYNDDSIIEGRVRFGIYELATNAWKYIDVDAFTYQGVSVGLYHDLSFNGNLYWTVYTSGQCCIRCFDFSLEMFKHFCVLPRNKKDCCFDVLSLFKGDRFSLLTQQGGSEKIRVWVTKNKIDDIGKGEAAVWMNFMTVSIPNLHQLCYYPTYFIEETYVRSLVICYTEESGKAFIYIVKGDVSKRIPLDYKDFKYDQCITYVPSLIPIPICSST